MGLLKSLLKLGVEVVKAPVAIVEDVVTLGGNTTDTKPATPKQLKKVIKKLI